MILLVTVILVISELIYFRCAIFFHITDNPNHRSSHTKPTILGGGIIFPIAVLCFAIWWSTSWLWVIGLLLISLVSFLDDIYTLANKMRIVVHLLAVSLLLYDLHAFQLWSIAAISLVYVLIIGTINAWNFMDGINGITALYSLSVLCTLWYLDNIYFFIDPALIIIIGIATIIFAFFNCRNKAICFAGDVGAVSLSFTLIFLILSLIISTKNLIFILVFAVYGVDSTMTICYRLFRKENIFKAHRAHFYQLMANEFGMPHLLVSIIYCVLQLLINLVLVTCLTYSIQTQWLIGVVILLLLTSLYWVARGKLARMI